jgi:hypothetical protein
VGRRQLVVARCDPPTLFAFFEEPLDQVASAGQKPAKQIGSLRLHIGGILASVRLTGSQRGAAGGLKGSGEALNVRIRE